LTFTSAGSRNQPSTLAGQRGAVLVEFALVLPILLLLLLGMMDFGRAINYWIDETHLANVTARFAAVDNNPGASSGLTLQEWTKSQAETEQLETADVSICLLGEPKIGEPVRVTVSYPFEWTSFISNEALGGITSTTLTGSATMRLEQVPEDFTPDEC
jgi:Flp pilus assembly protein TadG